MKHAKLNEHPCVVQIETRIVWCYICDQTIQDQHPSISETFSPTHSTSQIDEPIEPNPSEQDRQSESEHENEDELDDYRIYYESKKGGQTGLNNIGNT
jgi:hypothetical protein